MIKELRAQIHRLHKRSKRKAKNRGAQFHFQLEHFHKGKAEAYREILSALDELERRAGQ